MANLQDALDFILNHCTIREIDVVSQAVERRRRHLQATIGISTLDPASYAKNLGDTIQKSIRQTMSGMSESFKDFAWSMVKKESPELSDEEIEQVVQALIPDIGALQEQEKKRVNAGSPPVNMGSIPNEALIEMAEQFIAYSEGNLDAVQENELRSSMGEWTHTYWTVFPIEVRQLIKTYLEGEIDYITFHASLTVLLS